MPARGSRGNAARRVARHPPGGGSSLPSFEVDIAAHRIPGEKAENDRRTQDHGQCLHENPPLFQRVDRRRISVNLSRDTFNGVAASEREQRSHPLSDGPGRFRRCASPRNTAAAGKSWRMVMCLRMPALGIAKPRYLCHATPQRMGGSPGGAAQPVGCGPSRASRGVTMRSRFSLLSLATFVLAAGLVTLVSSGCSKSDSEKTGAKKAAAPSKLTIGVSLLTRTHPFYQELESRIAGGRRRERL